MTNPTTTPEPFDPITGAPRMDLLPDAILRSVAAAARANVAARRAAEG